MSLPVLIGGTTGLIVIVTLLYTTQEYVSGSGSTLAKYTVKKNSTCLSANTTTDQNNSSDYIKCMSELEMLVKTLINNGEIDLQDCELDGNNVSIAYCEVVTWYHPKTVIVTDSDSVIAITEKSNSTVNTAERRKRNTNDIYSKIVDEDIIAQNLLEKIQNTDLKVQRKLLSLSASHYQQQIVGESELNEQMQQYIQPIRPTDINPITEPPTSNDNLENLMEDKPYKNLVGLLLANEIEENISETEQNLESQLQKPHIYLDCDESVDDEIDD